jgi:hypothetical protein
MRKPHFVIALFILLLPLLATASQSKMDSFDLHVASLRVLEQKDVQAELGITPAQRDKMDKFASDYNQKLQIYLAQLKKENRTNVSMPDGTVVMMLGTLKQQVMQQLSPTQLKRLREISLQAFGLNGILDSTVAKKVGMTEDQIKRMRQTYEAGSKKANDVMASAMKPVNNEFKGKVKTEADANKMKAAYVGKGKAAMNAAMPTVQKVNDDTQARMLAIFTPQQKKAYLALQGKVFHSKHGRGM